MCMHPYRGTDYDNDGLRVVMVVVNAGCGDRIHWC